MNHAVVTVIMLLLVASTSCQAVGAPTPRLAPDDTDTRLAPDEARAMRTSCVIAEHRCSRCHSLDRVASHDAPSPHAWQEQVTRMRRLAGSTISRGDGDAITRCLVYRSFGPAGLAALPDPSPRGVAP